ncbi:hypothetical protein DXX94_05450 [Thalassotalea euphylliae]|uniref:Uncharacterized protein n=1 Tax=Thalassotalea euphylliae TaxID=1655234 RepID=A0A3E0U2E5_9GAMM|nr:hypothetical protein DXX94_05450 [Thalassotalea euphylliae]
MVVGKFGIEFEGFIFDLKIVMNSTFELVVQNILHYSENLFDFIIYESIKHVFSTATQFIGY